MPAGARGSSGTGHSGDTGGGGCPSSAVPRLQWSVIAQCVGYVSAWPLSHLYVGLVGGFRGSFDILTFYMLSENTSEFAVHPSVARGAALKKRCCLLTHVE